MVIPLNLGGGSSPGMEEQEVPEALKDSKCHCFNWYMLSFLFIATTVGCLVAMKIFDGLIALVIGIWAYYMVKDSSKNMSQQCLFSFGLMCVVQAVMEFIIMCMSLPGRRTQQTTYNNGGANGSPHAAPNPFMGTGGGAHDSSYTVTVKTTPFFSEEQGWHYNLQSAMMIVSCLVFVIGALLTRHSYGQYPNSMFEDRDGESQSLGGGGSAYSSSGGGGRYMGGGRPGNTLGGGNPSGGGQRSSGHPMFGGSGQRLGNA